MIVIGYQAIGKSTLASKNARYIDLESGNFWVDGKRADDWYKPYCQIAEHLSQQKYVVFTSSHEVVRNFLKENSKEIVVAVVPDPELKNRWIQRLEERYNQTQLEKDYKALKNAEDRYTENVKEIIDSGIPTIILKDTHYDLDGMLKRYETFASINKEAKTSNEVLTVALSGGYYNIGYLDPIDDDDDAVVLS